MDEHVCGSCDKLFLSIEEFVDHKKTKCSSVEKLLPNTEPLTQSDEPPEEDLSQGSSSTFSFSIQDGIRLCGSCGKEFTRIEAFIEHRKSSCNPIPEAAPRQVEVLSDEGDETMVEVVNDTEESELQFPTKCPHCPSSQISYLTQSSYETHCLVSHLGDDNSGQFQEEVDSMKTNDVEKAKSDEDTVKKNEKIIEDFKEYLSSNEDPLAYLINQAKKGNLSPLEGAVTRFLNSSLGKDIEKGAGLETENTKNPEDETLKEAFKKWCDSSVFKCEMCGWEGSRMLFIWHVRENHGDFGIYRKKYGNGLHVNKEHHCLICDKVIRLDHYTLHNHFKPKHKMAGIDYYKKYVAGTVEGIDPENTSKPMHDQPNTRDYWRALKDWLIEKLEVNLEVDKLFPEFNRDCPSETLTEEAEDAVVEKVQELHTENVQQLIIDEMVLACNSQEEEDIGEMANFGKELLIAPFEETTKESHLLDEEEEVIAAELLNTSNTSKEEENGEPGRKSEVKELKFPTKCPKCPSSQTVYLTASSYQAHCLVSHIYRCFLCSEMEKDISNMKRHFKTFHPEDSANLCTSCALFFGSLRMLQEHKCENTLLQGAAASLKALQEEGKPWTPSQCSHCPSSGVTYETPVSYETHCLETHPYQCPICPRMWSFIGTVKSHFKSVHKNIEPYFCHGCPIVFTDLGMFKNHACKRILLKKRVADEDRAWWDGCKYKCNHCEETFPESRDVTSHIHLKHIKKRPKKDWMAKKFARQIGTRHSGVLNKDFEMVEISHWHCELCSKTREEEGRELKRRDIKGIRRCFTAISQHIRNIHNAQSIEEYEEMVKNSISRIAEVPHAKLRTAPLGSRNFQELHRGTWQCKICKRHFTDRDSHLRKEHDITFPEYEHTIGVSDLGEFNLDHEVEEQAFEDVVQDIDEPADNGKDYTLAGMEVEESFNKEVQGPGAVKVISFSEAIESGFVKTQDGGSNNGGFRLGKGGLKGSSDEVSAKQRDNLNLFVDFDKFLASNENYLTNLINEAKQGNSAPLEGAIHQFLKDVWVGKIKRTDQRGSAGTMVKQTTIRGYRSTLKSIIYQYTDGQVDLELNKLFDSKLLMSIDVPLGKSVRDHAVSLERSNNPVKEQDEDTMDEGEVSKLPKLRIWPRPLHEQIPVDLEESGAEQVHESLKTELHPRKVNCPHCDHSAVISNDIMQHMKNEHSKSLDLKCPFCMEHAFKFKQNSPPGWLTTNVSTYLFKVLQIHVREAHEGTSERENKTATAPKDNDVDRRNLPPGQEDPWECRICNRHFQYQHRNRHMLQSHNNMNHQEDEQTSALGYPSYNYMVKEAIMAIRKKRSHKGASRKAIQSYITANYKVGNDSEFINSKIKQTLRTHVAKGVVKRNREKGTFKLVKKIPKTHMKRQRISELLDKGFKINNIAEMLGCAKDTVRRVWNAKRRAKYLDGEDCQNVPGTEIDEQNFIKDLDMELPSADPLGIDQPGIRDEKRVSDSDSHPSYITMVLEAITALQAKDKWNRDGVSDIAIKNFIIANYQVGDRLTFFNTQVREALGKYVAKGVLTHTGPMVYFKLVDDWNFSRTSEGRLQTSGPLDKDVSPGLSKEGASENKDNSDAAGEKVDSSDRPDISGINLEEQNLMNGSDLIIATFDPEEGIRRENSDDTGTPMEVDGEEESPTISLHQDNGWGEDNVEEEDGNSKDDQEVSELQFPTRCSKCPSSQIMYLTQSSYDTHCLLSHLDDESQGQTDSKEDTKLDRKGLGETTMNKRKKLFGDFKEFLASNENSLAYLLNKAKEGDSTHLEGAIHRFLKYLWAGHIKRDDKGNIPHTEYSHMLSQTTIRVFRSTLKNIIYEYSDGQVDLELNKLFPGLAERKSSNWRGCPKWLLLSSNRPQNKSVEEETIIKQEDSELQFPTKCSYCPSSHIVFVSEPSYEEHCLASHPYRCSLCSKRTNNPSHMQRHFHRLHPEHRPHICSCCAISFSSSDTLQHHKCENSLLRGAAASLKAMQEEGKPWVPAKCSHCPSSDFSHETSTMYVKHCLETHPYQCPICPKMLTYPGNLPSHFKSLHNNQEPHSCHKCPLVFLDSEPLKNHKCDGSLLKRSDQRGEKPWYDGCIYKCKHCEETFPDENDVQRHIYTEHTSPRTQEAVRRRKKNKNCGTLDKDFEMTKTTYWDCELCLKDGSGKNKGKGLLKQYSTIAFHVKKAHDAHSLEEYQDMLKKSNSTTESLTQITRGVIDEKFTPTISPQDVSYRTLRSSQQKDTKNFKELHRGTWECRICKRHYQYQHRNNHILHSHNMTPQEYECTSGLMRYMDQFAQEVKSVDPVANDIDIQETCTPQPQEPMIEVPVTEEVGGQVAEMVETDPFAEDTPELVSLSQDGQAPDTLEINGPNNSCVEKVRDSIPLKNSSMDPSTGEDDNCAALQIRSTNFPSIAHVPMEGIGILSSTKEPNLSQGNRHSSDTWECRICKKLLRFASPQSHLTHYHKMTYEEYMNIYNLGNVTDESNKIRPAWRQGEKIKPGDHPPYITMVKEAITAIRARIKWNRNGASRQAIVNYIAGTYNMEHNPKLINTNVKKTLRNYVAKGVLAYTSDNSKGACGSFKVVEKNKVMPKTHMKRLQISQLLHKGVPNMEIARMVACNIETVRSVIKLKKEGNILITKQNGGKIKSDVSSMPVTTTPDMSKSISNKLSTPPTTMMTNNASTDSSDIHIEEQHFFTGDYHIIVENPEDKDTPMNVEAEQDPPPFASQQNQWWSSMRSDSDIMKAFGAWSDSLIIRCTLCSLECYRESFQKHLKDVHRVCNKSKKLHENREHKCTLCNETVQQYHTNLENHFQEKHNLTALDYFKKYVAGLKEEHIPSEDEEEDGDDSEFIEAM